MTAIFYFWKTVEDCFSYGHIASFSVLDDNFFIFLTFGLERTVKIIEFNC